MSIDYAHVRTVTVKSITPLPNDRKISMWNGVFIITTKKERKMMNIQEKAGRILEFVGGKDNITYVTYCMTRLRITPKDKGLIQDEDIQKMTGIVGTKTVGTQYQIIIGPEVENVYKELCQIAGFEIHEGIDEIVDDISQKKEKLTPKSILNNVLDVIGGCVAPMLPIITAAGLVKLIVAVLGPSMLNIMSETSDFMRLLTFVGDAGFYFFPIYVAYAAAKKFQTNIPMALFIAGVLLHPTLIEIVNTGEAFTVYGIPMYLTTYSSNFVSMILIVWMMSYVEKGLNKVIPNALRALLFPLLTLLIMLPIALCILGPIGAILGKGIADGLVSLHTLVGPFSIAIIAACWPLLIVTGMHQALIAIALTYIATMGFDNSILVGAFISNYPMIAIGLTYLMKSKGAEEKGNALTSFVTLTIGGISEPTLFGIILRYKKAILYMLAGGFAGGFYAGLMNVAVYFVGSGNIAIALGFAGENANSLPQGIIACVIAFVVTLALSMIFGFDDKKEGRNNDSVISTK